MSKVNFFFCVTPRVCCFGVVMLGYVFIYIFYSITAPHAYGLLKGTPSENTQRKLILVSKILQNLANGILFGKKEEFMKKMNEFIENNEGRLNTFFDAIVVRQHMLYFFFDIECIDSFEFFRAFQVTPEWRKGKFLLKLKITPLPFCTTILLTKLQKLMLNWRRVMRDKYVLWQPL